MENRKEQSGLFTERDFRRRDIEQTELTIVKTNLDEPQVSVSYAGNGCVHYIGAGNCRLHGDTLGCEDCDDYKRMDDAATEDED